MKIIFIGTTGVHHTMVAANLLIGRDNHVRYSRLGGFADKKLESSGKPLLIHDDGRGTQIYSLGVGKDVALAERAMHQFIDILGFKSSDLLVQRVHMNGDKLLLWLIKMPAIGCLKTISRFLAEKLIEWQVNNIIRYVQQVKVRMGTVSCYD